MKAFKTLILTAALVCGGIMTANAQLGGDRKSSMSIRNTLWKTFRNTAMHKKN